MEQFWAITGRNMKIYLRDSGAVFFSLMSTFIVIGLMVFFLGDMNIEAITGILGEFPGRDVARDEENAKLLVLSWTSAGILAINAVTVTLSVFSGMIKDKASGRLNSIYTAPVSRLTIAAGYIAAAWVCSVIVCVVTLAVTEVYAVMQGMSPYSPQTHLRLLGLIMVNSFVFATLMYPVALLAKTEGAWSGLGTVIGTLVGFLGGIYIPIGSLADSISTLMKCTPILYSTAMFRKVMNTELIEETFANTSEDLIAEFRKAMGVDLQVFEHTLTVTQEWLLLVGCGILFLIIGACMLKYGKKTDR